MQTNEAPKQSEPPEDRQAGSPAREAGSGRWSHHRAVISQHRPPWWPESEPWPPRDRRAWRHARRHNPFLRRLGCLWVAANLIGISVLIGLVGTALRALSNSSPALFPWPVNPLGIGVLVALAIAAVTLGTVSMRRVSQPLDSLLDASRRIAEGDLSARVEEVGPSEVRSLISAFNSMAGQLQEHDEQRRKWLADVTHELRTPLTILQGNLEGVADGIYEANPERVKSMLEEVQVLTRLTDDLRILALAEAGDLQLRREPTDLSALIREVAAASRAQADASGIRLVVDLDPTIGAIDVDGERIKQVLNNVLFNAMRYTPAGKAVTIQGRRVQEAAGPRVVVSVEDQGPGIAPEDLGHVFDRYYKSADSRGMGLGLAISKHIVEAHGGEIAISSEPGKGTRTTFSLPA